MTEITRELFEQQRSPRFGNENPERMHLELWEWMIRAADRVAGGSGTSHWNFEEGKLLGAQTPYAVRQMLNVELDCAAGPIWTFDRLGATQTTLADGRIVCVGGEHEDFYDPDFCIYNDVVVLGPAAEIEIYGYPKEVFPPTDFHTATLAGHEIIVIGSIGYKDARRYGYTPAYRLDLADYHMTELVSSGDMPGWISKHTARLEGNDTIVITGGHAVLKGDAQEVYRPNIEEYALDVGSGRWQRLTHRNWRQFGIRMERHGMFDINHWPTPKKLLPEGIEYSVVECDSLLGLRIMVRGVAVAVSIGVSGIKILVEGELARDLVDRIVESVRLNAEKAVEGRCLLQEM
jgi:hypothetical protein